MMTTSVDAQIVELHLRHYTQELIVATLKTGKPRVSRCIREFHQSGVIPSALRIDRPSNRSSDLIAFVEARTLQSPSMSSSALSDEIATEFDVHLSRTTVNSTRKGVRFKYRPVRRNQALNESHKLGRLEFCRKMLSMPESLSLIHFSDESRLVLSDDKQ
jgi:transposase